MTLHIVLKPAALVLKTRSTPIEDPPMNQPDAVTSLLHIAAAAELHS